MAEKFDPYHQWLGIPASEQPPHHYRLLGIPVFEASPSVIENAADQRMAHLRTFQSGKQSAESQRLLNEVSTAKLCLLTAKKKTVYDQSLRTRLHPSGAAAGLVKAEAIDPQFAAIFEQPKPTGKPAAPASRKKKSQANNIILIATGALTAVALGFALFVTFGHDSTPASGEPSRSGEPIASAAPAKKPAPTELPKKESAVAATETNPEPKSSDFKTEIPKTEPPTVAVTTPEPKEVKPAASQEVKPVANHLPPVNPETKPGVKKEPKKEEIVAAVKLAPPSTVDQIPLIREVNEVYKPSDAKDKTAKAAVARKMLEDGRKNHGNRVEQFVLLRRAGEMARDAREAELMVEAVDAIAIAGFDIRPYAVKSRMLEQVLDAAASTSGAETATLSAFCRKFSEEAAADGATDEALEVINATKRSLARAFTQSQAAMRVAKAELAHARFPAELPERQKTIRDTQAELDALKSAQLEVTECAKDLLEARHDNEAIQAAREKLKAAPDDPDASLALGRLYCFQQDDWDQGLKLLANGSDEALKSLAAEELGSKPAKGEEQIARGDEWWDMAEKSTGREKSAMHQRASYWYQQAIPGLAPSLGKSRIEKRVTEAATEPAEAGRRPTGPRPPPAVAPFDEKTGEQLQARWAKYLHVPVVQTNSIGMKLALVPPGEFLMGSTEKLMTAEARSHMIDRWYTALLSGETPQHRARITKPYWLGVTDVTQEQFHRVLGSNPSQFQGEATRPVEQVSWEDAVEFCRALTDLPGEKAAKRRYCLPTEAQWEFACRAGSTSESSGFRDAAWYSGNSGLQTHPVGQKTPNLWGLYDMRGNVWQWCQDYYDPMFYATSVTDDPTGPATGTLRVCRGGSFPDLQFRCRSAFRNPCPPETRSFNLGFRVAIVPAGK